MVRKLLPVIFGVLFLYWTAVVVIASTTFALAVTGVGEDEAAAVSRTATPDATATPAATPTPERPAEVPSTAALVTNDTTLPASGARLFFSLRCEDSLLAVSTTTENIFATVDCTQYWLPDDVLRPFLGTPVEIRVARGTPTLLFVDSEAGGTLRFEADAVWIDE
jgi:hypothetical protein